MSVEKFQHFVPRMQLKRFTDSNGKLIVWNKRAGKLLEQTPSNTFGETHLYTIENELGEKDTWFEKELGKIETSAAILLDEIEGAAAQGLAPTFSDAEKAHLDLFFYTAWKRVPDFFGKAESINAGSDFLDEIFEMLLAKHPDRKADINALNTPESRKRLLQSGKIQGMAVPSEKILNLFAQRGLVILQLPPASDGFLIGSLPVVRTRHPLTDPEAEAWMPISPRLAIGPGMTAGSVTLAEFDPVRLTGFNRVVAKQSTMFGGPDPLQLTKMSEWLKSQA